MRRALLVSSASPRCRVLAAPYTTAASAPTRNGFERLKPGRVPPRMTMKQKRELMASLRATNKARNEHAESEAKKKQLPAAWQLRTAIIVERPQIITPEPEPWLKEYIEWRHKWDEPILKQMPHINILDEDIDQMKQREADEKKAAAAREKALNTETPEEREFRLKKEEREKRMAELRKKEEESKLEKPGPRITEADLKNDLHSLRRKLDKKLFLIVKEKPNATNKEPGNSPWRFPEGIRQGDETLRQIAEASLLKETGTKLETYFVGNAPITFHTRELSDNQQKQFKAYGAKTFFQYAYFLNGNVTLDSSLADYAWVTRDELKDYLSPSVLEAVMPALPPDGYDLTIPKKHYIDYKKQAHA